MPRLFAVTGLVLAALALPAAAAEEPKPEAAKPEQTKPEQAKPELPKVAPLKLEAGKPLDIVCETRAVSVADDAQATTGSVRLRLELVAQPASGADKPAADAPAGPTGRWSIADVSAAHVASFALKQREVCGAAPCPFEPGQGADSLHLWAPSKVMPDKLSAGASMSLAALDLAGLTLRVSTFRDGAIAALEQGDCKPAP